MFSYLNRFLNYNKITTESDLKRKQLIDFHLLFEFTWKLLNLVTKYIFYKWKKKLDKNFSK